MKHLAFKCNLIGSDIITKNQHETLVHSMQNNNMKASEIKKSTTETCESVSRA